MCKAENSPSRLVFPLDDLSKEIKQHIQHAGFSEVDSDWLIDVFKGPDCFGDPTGDSTFNEEFSLHFRHILRCRVDELSEPVQVEEVRQTRLAFLLHSLLGFGRLSDEAWLPNVRPNWSDGSADVPEWLGEFQKHAQFCPQNLDWYQLKELSRFEDLLPFLLPNGVPLSQLVNLDRLDPIPRRNWSSNDPIDPGELEFWLKWRFGDNKKRCDKVRLGALLQDFSDFPDDVLGDKILGLLNAIYNAMTRASWELPSEERLDPLNDGWKVVAHELIPFLELLIEKHPELNNERSPLLKAWWHLSKVVYSWSNGGLESELSDELRNRLVDSASKHIGRLRSVLRDTPEVFEDEKIFDFYDKAFYVLLCFAPPWKRLKPLLLAFAAMTEQAVARDLRTWREHDSTNNPPIPYVRVPNWIEIAMYPQHLHSELREDQHLQDLREKFALFCLERLKTNVKNKESGYADEDFVESRRAWRWCYVQALAALRVNPGGRSHRNLFWLLNNDPDETVRELAKRAHKRVRHLDRSKPNLDKGASPRRPLFEAFWWLRQAHLITLGVEVDSAGAMRTRRKELHRTREKGDRFNWKS